MTTTSPLPITVIGSVNRDRSLRVAHLPQPGETVPSADPVDSLGGKGANQAVAAARLGGRVTLVAAIGTDGEDLVHQLAQEGVRLEPRQVDAPTGSATVLVDEDGDNVVVVASGANGRLTAQDLPTSLTGVLVLQHEVPAEVVHTAVRRAAPEALVLLNPAPFHPVPPAVLDRVDVLVLNQTEAAALADTDEPRDHRDIPALLDRLPTTRDVVITLGAAGAAVRSGGELTSVPGVPVDTVDTVGAGDTFCGALAVRLAAGEDLPAAARYAVHAAALAVTRPGAQAGMPTNDAVRALIADRSSGKG